MIEELDQRSVAALTPYRCLWAIEEYPTQSVCHFVEHAQNGIVVREVEFDYDTGWVRTAASIFDPIDDQASYGVVFDQPIQLWDLNFWRGAREISAEAFQAVFEAARTAMRSGVRVDLHVSVRINAIDEPD